LEGNRFKGSRSGAPSVVVSPRQPTLIVTGEELRRAVLETIERYVIKDGASNTQTILNNVSANFKIQEISDQRALLSCFYGLFYTGYLSWGKDLSNSDPPWFHITQQGRKALENASRDPANPDGYLTYLKSQASLNAVAESYVHEALVTFNAQCYKAAAVMIGVAAEALALSLRDDIVSKMQEVGQPVPRELADWRAKIVLDSIEEIIRSKERFISRNSGNSGNLFQRFDYQWS